MNSYAGTDRDRTRAIDRVENDPDLAPYYDIIIGYDWGYGNEHMHWITTEDKGDLLEWAEGIRADEESSDRDDPS